MSDNLKKVSMLEGSCKLLYDWVEKINKGGNREAFLCHGKKNDGGNNSDTVTILIEMPDGETKIWDTFETYKFCEGNFVISYMNDEGNLHTVVLNRYNLEVEFEHTGILHFINKIGGHTAFEYSSPEETFARTVLVFNNHTGKLVKHVKNVIERRISRELYVELSIRYFDKETNTKKQILFTRKGEISTSKYMRDMGLSILIDTDYQNYLFTRTSDTGKTMYGLIDNFFQNIKYINRIEYNNIMQNRKNKKDKEIADA